MLTKGVCITWTMDWIMDWTMNWIMESSTLYVGYKGVWIFL